MVIGRKFNELNFKEYIFHIDNHKKHRDFNTLGLYRSLMENSKLSLEDKIAVRDYAHSFFKKSFDFLQLKDPYVFIEVSSLGLELTIADERKMWDEVKNNQQKILNDKRIKHRNFGVYSKHNCPYDDCIYNGLMVSPGSHLAETNMHFAEDSDKYGKKIKSDRRKAERKKVHLIIKEQTEN